ncbi:MAG TPA: zinc-dependent metalloprotease [Bryobacteraceae bacterium]|nr:zinc-dependent metalloprotease [Bryobacteraceae bacterium]
MRRLLLLCLAFLPLLTAAPPKSIADVTRNMRKLDGYFPLYWDEIEGKMWLEIDHFNREFLYLASLPAGVGSNEIGLDRGLLTGGKVVAFERTGPRVLLVQKNYRFRSSSANPMETRAVADSFATSALWGFDVQAVDGDKVLVDATGFFEHDFVGVAAAMANTHQGAFTLDPSRCAFYLDRTKGFPANSEVEVTLTFRGDHPGSFVREVTPAPESVTVREHHSLIQLPEDGYQPRAFDPRAGYGELIYRDYSAPLGEEFDKRLIHRHRLVKRDPGAAVSEAVKPLIYYIDGGAPADVLQALTEGARWWNQAFEAAGFRDGFQVRTLPPDADPMDIRYNVVQWVHRFTRGWSYGNSIADPRTGEILKGQVTLGSLRYRQDYLIFSGLLSPFGPSAASVPSMKDAVYARLRQLSAHEIGHTLGLAHNYIASTQNNASVMDYPHPRVDLLPDGALDLSHAYPTGIGEWDKVAIRYGYTQFPSGADEHKALDGILLDAARSGDISITDADSRPLGSANPHSHLWDNGPNTVDELQRILKVRQAALARFGENSVPADSPMSSLDDTLVPLYYLHRYQTEAAGKSLGGLDYTYTVRGDGQLVTKIVPATEQRRALMALLETISPKTLTLPERILLLIPPHPPGYPRNRETFPSRTGLTFDPVAAAEAAADLTASLLFNPERAARLAQYHARNQANPSFTEVVQTVAKATWLAPPPAGLEGEIKATVDIVLLERLLQLAADPEAATSVKATALSALESGKARLPFYVRHLLDEFERDPKNFQVPKISPPPPGQPIGEEECGMPLLPAPIQ